MKAEKSSGWIPVLSWENGRLAANGGEARGQAAEDGEAKARKREGIDKKVRG